jgi:hypothetical protein
MDLRPALLLSLLLAAPAVPAAETGSARSRCLDPHRARSWLLLDSDELLVDAGRRRFHLQLAFACPELGYNDAIHFLGSDPGGRICGLPGDRIVLARRSLQRRPCTILSVTALGIDEYEAIQARGPRTSGEVSVREVPER